MVRLCSSFGLEAGSNSFPVVVGCAFNSNGIGVSGVPIGAVPNFSGNTSGGNTVLDVMEVTDDSFSGNVTIAAMNALNGNGQFVFCMVLVVAAGQMLTLGPGLLIKMSGRCLNSRILQVSGTLVCNGVDFTSIHDDGLGGDTNKNGNATVPQPGDWFGFRFLETSDASVLRNVFMAYAGGFGTEASVELNQADITLETITIQDGANHGITLQASSFPTMTGCTIRRCQGVAIREVPPQALPRFTANQASQNTVGDYVFIRLNTPTPGGTYTITSDLEIAAASALNGDGLFVMETGLIVAQGATLRLGPGVVFKTTGNVIVSVDGTLRCQGLAGSPVVFTSIHDDLVLGDRGDRAGRQRLGAVGGPRRHPRPPGRGDPQAGRGRQRERRGHAHLREPGRRPGGLHLLRGRHLRGRHEQGRRRHAGRPRGLAADRLRRDPGNVAQLYRGRVYR